VEPDKFTENRHCAMVSVIGVQDCGNHVLILLSVHLLWPYNHNGMIGLSLVTVQHIDFCSYIITVCRKCSNGQRNLKSSYW